MCRLFLWGSLYWGIDLFFFFFILKIVGIKSNFAQPFFVHWDTILGTKMTREEMEQRKKQSSLKQE
jgi:hypothetical protein